MGKPSFGNEVMQETIERSGEKLSAQGISSVNLHGKKTSKPAGRNRQALKLHSVFHTIKLAKFT